MVLGIENHEGIGDFFERFAIEKRQLNGHVNGHMNGKINGRIHQEVSHEVSQKVSRSVTEQAYEQSHEQELKRGETSLILELETMT